MGSLWMITEWKYTNRYHYGIKNTMDKYDQEKPDVDLVLSGFRNALIEVSKVGTFGAKKYTRHGFIDVPDGELRYSSAMLRHYFAHFDEYRDEESGYSHLAHMTWNALAILELHLRGNL